MKIRKYAAMFAILAGIFIMLTHIWSCDSLMDNTTENPHPPFIANLVVSPTVIRSGDDLAIAFSYFDEGQDIQSVFIRDKQSGEQYQGSPT